VRELTAEAARRAALGAGARLVGTFANRLTQADVEHIVALAPIFCCSRRAPDGGNSEVILYNAAALGSSALVCPVVLAATAMRPNEAATLLAGREVIRCDNVMPNSNVLDIEPDATRYVACSSSASCTPKASIVRRRSSIRC